MSALLIQEAASSKPTKNPVVKGEVKGQAAEKPRTAQEVKDEWADTDDYSKHILANKKNTVGSQKQAGETKKKMEKKEAKPNEDDGKAASESGVSPAAPDKAVDSAAEPKPKKWQ
jgi:hypothetical protein